MVRASCKPFSQIAGYQRLGYGERPVPIDGLGSDACEDDPRVPERESTSIRDLQSEPPEVHQHCHFDRA